MMVVVMMATAMAMVMVVMMSVMVLVCMRYLWRECSFDEEYSPLLTLQLRQEGPEVQVTQLLGTGQQTIQIPG